MSSHDGFLMNGLKNSDEPDDDHETADLSELFKNTECRKCTILKYIFVVFILTAVLGLMYACLTHNVRNQCSTKFNNQTNTTKANNLCTSLNCIQSAMSIAQSMNRSVDPCKDFYQFACGNYYKVHPTSRSSVSKDQFSEAEAKMITLIRDFMEKKDIGTEQIDIKKSRDFYHSCMAQDENYTTGLTSLIKLLKNIGLPPLGFHTDNSTNRNLSSILARIKKHANINYLFTINIKPNQQNRNINEIYLSKPQNLKLFQYDIMSEMTRKINSRTKPDTDKEDVKYKISFDKYFRSVWKEINAFITDSSNNYNSSELQEQILHSLTFERELEQIIEKQYETENQSPIVMDVDEFQTHFDNTTKKNNIIDWKQFINELFMDMEFLTVNFTTDLIQIKDIDYFEALRDMLIKYDETKVVHLWWKVVSTMVPFTSRHLRLYKDIFDYETTGYKSESDQSLYCADVVKKTMGPTISYFIIDDELRQQNMKTVDEIMTNIRRAFEHIVNNTEWMDQTSKNRTLLRAQQIKTRISYPEYIKNATQPVNYYSNFNVTKNDFCGNIIQYVQLDLINTIWKSRQFNNNYSDETWESNPLDCNVVYLHQKNMVEVSVGMIQYPFIGHDLQMLNYGHLGSILGHEFTYGFVHNSRQFNQDGKELDWWTFNTTFNYQNRIDCLINHYNLNKINDKSLLLENIADIGGLKEALMAYKEFVVKNGKEPKLPGLEQFNDEQLYYLAFANNFCETSSTNKSRSNDLLDVYSPNNIRINSALIHFPEFNKVWGCEKNLKMNIINNICEIW